MDALWTDPPAGPGEAELALAKTLDSWAADGILAGPGDSAARLVLLDHARAVDMARRQALSGAGGRNAAYQLARCAAQLGAELRRHGRGPVADHDPIQSLIDEITSGTTIHNGPESG